MVCRAVHEGATAASRSGFIPERPFFRFSTFRFQLCPSAPIQVRGWPELDAPAERDPWTETQSDHAMLYSEVTGLED
jgi:hypothetical protein